MDLNSEDGRIYHQAYNQDFELCYKNLKKDG
jgi:hypothetical protein